MKHLLLAIGLSAALVGCTQKVAAPAETTPEPAASAAPAAPAEAQAQQSPAAAEPATSTAATGAAPGQPIPSHWKADTNYQLVVPAQSTSVDPGQVEVIEFMWLGCPHCYELNPYVEAWRKKLPAYVKFKQVPVTWDAQRIPHARLFFTMEALGGGDAMVVKAFEEIHRKGNAMMGNTEAASQQLQLTFAVTNGLDGAAFQREYNGFAVNAAIQRANQLIRVYRVDNVPTFVVNGKYRTDVGSAGSPEELMQLLTDLAASEKTR